MSVFARMEIPFVFLRSESSESEFRKIDVGFCQKSYHRCCAIKVLTSVEVCNFSDQLLGQLCWQIRALGFSNLAD